MRISLHTRGLVICLACALVTLAPESTWAAGPVVIDSDTPEYSIGLHLHYLEDKDGTLLVKDVLKYSLTKG